MPEGSNLLARTFS